MKATDISDEAFLDAMRTVRALRPHAMIGRWDVGFVLGGQADYVAETGRHDAEGHHPVDREWPEPVVPEKVVLAKARKLIKRGVITGCACGCRGDFEIAE